MTGDTEKPPVKAAWVHPKTYRMLLAFRLIKDDSPHPFLHDGRYVVVNELMPSTGVYDAPSPALERAFLAAKARAEATEMAA